VTGTGQVLVVSTCFPSTDFYTALRFSPSCNLCNKGDLPCVQANNLTVAGTTFEFTAPTGAATTIDVRPDHGSTCYITVLGSSLKETGNFGVFIRESVAAGPPTPTPTPSVPATSPSPVPVPTTVGNNTWTPLNPAVPLVGFKFRLGSLSLSYTNTTESVLAIGEPAFQVNRVLNVGRVRVVELQNGQYVQLGQDIVGTQKQERVGWYVKLVAIRTTDVGITGTLYVGSLVNVRGDGPFAAVQVFQLENNNVWYPRASPSSLTTAPCPTPMKDPCLPRPLWSVPECS